MVARPNLTTPYGNKGVCSVIVPDGPEHRTGVVVVYDLREPGSWEQARDDRETWGNELSEIHRLDNDRVVIVFKPGGALEASA